MKFQYVVLLAVGLATSFWAGIAIGSNDHTAAVGQPTFPQVAATRTPPKPKSVPFSVVLARSKAICDSLGLNFAGYNAGTPPYIECDSVDFRSSHIDLPQSVLVH